MADLQRRVRVRTSLRVVPLDDVRVVLVGEHEHFLLEGRLYRAVVPLLDGRSVAEVATALAGRASVAEVVFVITTLERKGHVVSAATLGSESVDAFWHALGSRIETVEDRLSACPVRVVGLGEDVEDLMIALRGAGIRVIDDADALAVVVVPDYLADELVEFNNSALANRRRWLPVKPNGLTPWIGPVFAPGHICWECLAARVRMNRPVETFLNRVVGGVAPPRVGLPTTISAGLQLAALTLAWWIADGYGAIDDHLLAWDWRALAMQRHAVRRRPQCPACGDPTLFATRAHEPVTLRSRPRMHADNGFRTSTAEATYERLAHLVSPISGVVAELRPAPGRDHPMRPVWTGVYAVTPMTDTPGFDAFTRLSMGKGRTGPQSRTSALCEALERQSARFHGDEPRRRACFAEVEHGAVHPYALQNFSEAQYAGREAWNAKIREANMRVPVRVDERTEIDWSPAWSLTAQRTRLVPTTYCFRDAPAGPGERCCGFNPNGHAAGNTLEEAALQGFLELVERDAVALWWYSRAVRPGVDLAGLGDAWVNDVVRHYDELGWEAYALDVTTDLEIPVVVALARHRGDGRMCIGFGCHLDGGLAVQRALTELGQLFDPAVGAPAPFDVAGLERSGGTAFLRPSAHVRVPANFLKEDAPADLRDDVQACVAAASRLGLETLVVDQTRPDIGLSVIKVIVPGLRHFWPRFGAGRLYEVPVRLGWIERVLDESELNPVHLFL